VAPQLGVTDVERGAVRNLLVGTIERDRYPFKTGVLKPLGRPSGRPMAPQTE
jgi:hypothetical protein